MAYLELDLVERRGIENVLSARMSIREIAEEFGQHRSSITARSSGNGFVDGELKYPAGC